MASPSKEGLLLCLRIACWLTVATGLMASLASHSQGEFLWLKLFDLLQWPLDNNPSSFSAESQAINAVLGGVMIGWGIMMHGLLEKGIFQERIRRLFLLSIFAWFISDSLGSVIAGNPANLILNLAFLGMFIVPLFMLKKFTSGSQP